jgi:magnesium chelatase family protein
LAQGGIIVLSRVFSCCFHGLEGYGVEIETFISGGLPALNIVGLPDASINESKERVRSAIKNTGLEFPMGRITVNMAPADIRKEGTHFDLGIAVGIIISSGQAETPDWLGQTAFIGELSLGGRLKDVNGVLPMAIAMKELGFKRLVVPLENAPEASMAEGIEVYGLRTLYDTLQFLKDESFASPYSVKGASVKTQNHMLDFSDVRGQENAKRAMEIAAAGMHNIILIGPPGSGKTMLARRLPSIMPALTQVQAFEVTKIYSIAGKLKGRSMIKEPPFRAPHHTISATSLIGGGSMPKPGEISLAHHGVLFLDEIPEFPKRALEALRQPMENEEVTISRVNATLTYPAKFLMAASANPCPCGYHGQHEKQCRCSPADIERYFGRISGPLLDRIDLQVEVRRVSFDDLKSKSRGPSSAEIRERVIRAREIQYNRLRGRGIMYNSQLSARDIQELFVIEPEAEDFLKKAYNRLGLSARAYTKILKTARTIADLGDRRDVSLKDIAEALQYRISYVKDGI